MSAADKSKNIALPVKNLQRHGIGVLCGLAAGVWLGAAEAPTKLVNTGLSPFAISLCMVAGVFTARWSFPTLLKGTRAVFADLSANRHLLVPAVLAGMLWAVANTLTVFAIRDVGLSIAFPLWNTNSLVGILWGRLLFGELKGASRANILRVLTGAAAIVLAAVLLGFSTLNTQGAHGGHALAGVLAALGASLLWGTMYIPYRKAYISGMTPLSFVTVFTVGELATVFALVLAFDGGFHAPVFHSAAIHGMLFWLFLGGFVWVVGDLFQQYATKFLGIGRGIPLSNTNQIWGLAWGMLVFSELAHADALHRGFAIAGSIVMILGAILVSTAVESAGENASTEAAIVRECERYSLDRRKLLAANHAANRAADRATDRANESASEGLSVQRSWWDYLVLAAALGVFAILGVQAQRPTLGLDLFWVVVLSVILLASAIIGGRTLWRFNRFS